MGHNGTMIRRLVPLALFVALFVALVLVGAARGEDVAVGVIADSVHPEGIAAEAGLQEGDRIVRWRRAEQPWAPEAGGEVGGILEWLRIQLEEAQRGDVDLTTIRGEETHAVRLKPGYWLLEVRPRLAEKDLELYREGLDRMAGDEPAEGSEILGALASRHREAGTAETALWLDLRRARAFVERGEYEPAQAVLEGTLGTTSGGFEAALVHEALGDLLVGPMSRFDEAETHYQRVLELHRKRAGEGLAVAEAYHDLVFSAHRRDDLEAVAERTRRVSEIFEGLAPESARHGSSLSNLGYTHWLQGDLVTAEHYYRRALAIQTDLGPIGMKTNLLMLGHIAKDRGDLETAETLARESLRLTRATEDDPLRIANSMSNLSGILETRGAFDEARSLEQEALALRLRFAPESHDVASSLAGLGSLARRAGRLEEAEKKIEEALAIRERLVPGGLGAADSHQDLGWIAMERGGLDDARRHFESALAIRERLAPASPDTAESLRALGQVARLQGRTDAALDHFLKAVELLEEQRHRLGGSVPVRSRSASRRSDLYWETVDLLVTHGRFPEAFAIHERGRARAFLDSLAERRIDWSGSIPDELESRRRSAIAAYESALGGLARLNQGSGEGEVRAARQRLEAARSGLREIESEVRAAAPRFADLRYPEPLDLEGARVTLDAGTLFLSYLVGEEATFVFAVGPGDGFTAHRLPVGRADLAGRVRQVRRLVERPSRRGATTLSSTTGPLSETLLAPVTGRLAGAEQVLIAPDGPLHFLPFALLPEPGSHDRYLIESLPLAFTPSVTAWATLRPDGGTVSRTLVAFADPVHPSLTGDETGPALRSLTRWGQPLAPLPAARREAEWVTRNREAPSVLHLGPEATESRVKSLTSADIVHFACHAIVDPEHPMESGLVLAPSDEGEGEDNGLLQVWEIYDSVRFEANLVTLSACETGLGEELAGEGVLGLARAFNFAGARTVLATLWKVADLSTAVLMERFYGHLQAGLPTAEALRRAQLELLREPVSVGEGDDVVDSRHPYYWAGFQLSGG